MTEKEFGVTVARLINKSNLSYGETVKCFEDIVLDKQSQMQQGAFLAALTAKGATSEEIAAVWRVIYEMDTNKVSIDTEKPLVENCGTGMDAIKTFNISTVASIIAAADGIAIARHGARAITSKCGTVDIVEELGINVECDPHIVKKSIESCGIGIFNGMSARVHPKTLSRILSQISFGTVLNVAASLANPASPKMAVRGVYKPQMLLSTAQTMREIGYHRAIVVYGKAEGSVVGGIDEASTMGKSHICELTKEGNIIQYTIEPEQFGIRRSYATDLLMGQDKNIEARRIENLLVGKDTLARTSIACLNAGLIFYLVGFQPSIKAGYERAMELLHTEKPINKLREWVSAQQ